MKKTCEPLFERQGWTYKRRSSMEHVSDIWPARTYLHQVRADTGCSLEDRLGAMDEGKGGEKERERERERVREVYTVSAT